MPNLFVRATAAMLIAMPGMLFALDCPEPPRQVAREISNDTFVGVKALKKLLGEAGVENKTNVLVKDLYEKYPNADRLVIATLLLSQFCSLLADSEDLSSERKFELFDRVQERVLSLVVPAEDNVGHRGSLIEIVDVSYSAGILDLKLKNSGRDSAYLYKISFNLNLVGARDDCLHTYLPPTYVYGLVVDSQVGRGSTRGETPRKDGISTVLFHGMMGKFDVFADEAFRSIEVSD